MTDIEEEKHCFAIMPIADPEDYPAGHFGHVYEDIIRPASDAAGYTAIRADQVKETNLIHLDILKKLLEAPIAVCDLSTRNPNVLFELGLRQAFDKPVVLIQESGTPKIFDITPLRYIEYSKDMKYHEVLNMQKRLTESIEATAAAESDASSINSIVKLLALSNSAQIPDLEGSKDSLALEVLQSEMRNLRHMIEVGLFEGPTSHNRGSIAAIEYERISSSLDKLINAKRIPEGQRIDRYKTLMREAEELMHTCENESEHRHMMRLMERIHRAERDIFA